MAWYEWWNEASKRKEEEEKSGVAMLAWQEGVGGGWERESQKCQKNWEDEFNMWGQRKVRMTSWRGGKKGRNRPKKRGKLVQVRTKDRVLES